MLGLSVCVTFLAAWISSTMSMLHSQVAWITPSELFSPAYGESIARLVSEHHATRPSSPLDIVEIGSGNGTLAVDILVHPTDLTSHSRLHRLVWSISSMREDPWQQSIDSDSQHPKPAVPICRTICGSPMWSCISDAATEAWRSALGWRSSSGGVYRQLVTRLSALA